MHDHLPKQAATCYEMLRQVVQHHATTERLGDWNVYMATLSLLAAVCREWCARGTAPPTLLADIAQALKDGLATGSSQPPLHSYPLPTAEAVEASKIAATQSLTRALAILLGDVGRAQGLSLDTACRVAMFLVRDTLVVFLQDHALVEIAAILILRSTGIKLRFQLKAPNHEVYQVIPV
jgi:hypothetical protein